MYFYHPYIYIYTHFYVYIYIYILRSHLGSSNFGSSAITFRLDGRERPVRGVRAAHRCMPCQLFSICSDGEEESEEPVAQGPSGKRQTQGEASDRAVEGKLLKSLWKWLLQRELQLQQEWLGLECRDIQEEGGESWHFCSEPEKEHQLG